MLHWRAYKRDLSHAKDFRASAVIFAKVRDWTAAYHAAAIAANYQQRADKQFTYYLDGLALNDACDNAPGFDPGVSVGDLARDAKDPHDIRS